MRDSADGAITTRTARARHVLITEPAPGMSPAWYPGPARAPMPRAGAAPIVGDVRHPPGTISRKEGATIMFLLAHSRHLTGPLAVLLTVAMIALSVSMRRARSSRGRRG